MATFLLKTEPGAYSFDDLVRDKGATWDGVSNAAALIALRAMKKGDKAYIYHTGDERAIVGIAVVTRGAYEDPKNPGVNAKGEPTFAVVDLKPGKRAKRPVTLDAIKKDNRFARFPLVTIGRLSVMPVEPEIDRALRQLADL
jgi:predicted RNA-binding protein with PUA-like domain